LFGIKAFHSWLSTLQFCLLFPLPYSNLIMSSVSEESRCRAAHHAFISHLVDGSKGAVVLALVVPEVVIVGGDEVLSTVLDRGAGSDEEEDVVMESEGFCGLDVLKQVTAIHCDEEVGVLLGEFLVWSGLEGEGNGAVEGGAMLVFSARDFWICWFWVGRGLGLGGWLGGRLRLRGGASVFSG
jgi:hypothetical protein